MPTTTKKASAPRAKKTTAARPTMEVDLAPTDHDVPLLGGPGAGMAHVLDVPITDLTPHPDNVRHDVDDLEEIADSIRTRGILQRLVVAPTPIGADNLLIAPTPYLVIAGHRRLAAAALAGLDRVPVEIRYDLATLDLQVEAMLVENIHRKDLTPVEEGEAYQTLLDLGSLDEDGIAHATGRSLTTVRRRLRLANAPVAVRNAVHAGMATLADADKLDDLLDEPDLIDGVTPYLGTPDFAWRLQNALTTRKGRLDARANDEAYRAAGVRVLEDSELPAGWAVWNGMVPVPVDRMDTYYQTQPDERAQLVADHAKDCPHAVWVWPKAVHACMEPGTHRPATLQTDLADDGDGEHEDPAHAAARAAQAQADAEARVHQQAARDEWTAAALATSDVRHSYVIDLIEQGTDNGQASRTFRELVRVAFGGNTILEFDTLDMSAMARRLGADQDTIDQALAADWQAVQAVLAERLDATKRPAAAALAGLLQWGPDRPTLHSQQWAQGWRALAFTEEETAWVQFLVDLGYTPSSWETDQVAAHHAAVEADRQRREHEAADVEAEEL